MKGKEAFDRKEIFSQVLIGQRKSIEEGVK
jgi:hypothetical protein